MASPEQYDDPVIKIEMTPTQATEFVERMAGEAAFRQRYRTDTRNLLAEYGVDVPEDLIPENLEPPSSESLQEALAALREGRPFTLSPEMGMAGAVLAYQCYMFMRRTSLPQE